MLSVRYLVGISLVLLAATFGWFVLAGTIGLRTQQSDTAQRAALAGLWGGSQEQREPEFTAVFPNGAKHWRTDQLAVWSSRIDVALALDLRRKGLLWYNTYGVQFAGTYRIPNKGRGIQLCFALPADGATYDDVGVFVDGRQVNAASSGGKLVATLPAARGVTRAVTVRYRSRGLGTWQYRFGEGVNTVRAFTLKMRTNFAAIDFPPNTLAPTAERRTADGWELAWEYRELVTGAGIGMALPSPLQPGPLAERITFWAPLSLGFYVFVMLVITTLRRIDLHPVNYLFLAGAFFAFHLLFAYTIDRIPVEWAFVLCAAVSMALTVSYLRLVVGLRFAAVEAAAAQFFYQILFSLALFDEGFSGLAITIGAIATLFVMMQLTGRIRWSERFASRAPATGTG
ncbi:MAG TPA: inner membrane CreD family protein [Candidatus Limnocylindrales bacterium]|nr:inner membrane CreD family protein [Candidatus Limnocylindrales bacterium]